LDRRRAGHRNCSHVLNIPRQQQNFERNALKPTVSSSLSANLTTPGAALADTLHARHQAGERVGDYAQQVAGHIRRNLNDYRTTEQHNVGRLKDTQNIGRSEARAAARPACEPCRIEPAQLHP
jgi:hypothetical protein